VIHVCLSSELLIVMRCTHCHNPMHVSMLSFNLRSSQAKATKLLMNMWVIAVIGVFSMQISDMYL